MPISSAPSGRINGYNPVPDLKSGLYAFALLGQVDLTERNLSTGDL